MLNTSQDIISALSYILIPPGATYNISSLNFLKLIWSHIHTYADKNCLSALHNIHFICVFQCPKLRSGKIMHTCTSTDFQLKMQSHKNEHIHYYKIDETGQPILKVCYNMFIVL